MIASVQQPTTTAQVQQVLWHALELLNLSGEFLNDSYQVIPELWDRFLQHDSVRLLARFLTERIAESPRRDSLDELAQSVAREYGEFLSNACEACLRLRAVKSRNSERASYTPLREVQPQYILRIPLHWVPEPERREVGTYLEYLQARMRHDLNEYLSEPFGIRLPLEGESLETFVQRFAESPCFHVWDSVVERNPEVIRRWVEATLREAAEEESLGEYEEAERLRQRAEAVLHGEQILLFEHAYLAFHALLYASQDFIPYERDSWSRIPEGIFLGRFRNRSLTSWQGYIISRFPTQRACSRCEQCRLMDRILNIMRSVAESYERISWNFGELCAFAFLGDSLPAYVGYASTLPDCVSRFKDSLIWNPTRVDLKLLPCLSPRAMEAIYKQLPIRIPPRLLALRNHLLLSCSYGSGLCMFLEDIDGQPRARGELKALWEQWNRHAPPAWRYTALSNFCRDMKKALNACRLNPEEYRY